MTTEGRCTVPTATSPVDPRTQVPSPEEQKQVCPLSNDALVDAILKFIQELTQTQFYNYQFVFCRRIIESVILNDGETITGLWSRQSGKCLARGTPVMLHDGTIRPVEEIRVGDLLMGDDSAPRRVLSLARGRERMVRVVPTAGYHEPYTVNRSHILSVQRRKMGSSALRPRPFTWEVEDVPVESLIGKDLGRVFGYKVPVEFPETEVPVDPYFLGLWLGDGSERAPQVTTMDPEIEASIREYAERLGMRVSRYEEAPGNAASTYAVVDTPGRANPLKEALRGLNLLENKHVPQVYKSNSRGVRLSLLAGLIDTDGYRSTASGKESVCEVVQVNRRLAEDIQWLARSLGFRAGISEKVVNGVSYWRTMLYGDLSQVPTRLPRKQYPKSVLREDPLRYGFRLEELPEDDYFGFVIDGNRRFLLGDCTVTHNTESLADLGFGLCVILPTLANAFPDDPRLIQYKGGFWVGIFAPILEQATISFTRMRNLTDPKRKPITAEIMADPEVDVSVVTNRGDTLSFSNGSLIQARSASPDSQVEGKTYHLVMLEESQKLLQTKVDKEIRPMLASTHGSMVKIGTAWISRGGFHKSIQYNLDQWKRTGVRNHFEFPYDLVIKEKEAMFKRDGNPFHKNYAKFVEDEIRRLGGTDSIEFKMNFRCLWNESRILAVDSAVMKNVQLDTIEAGYGGPVPNTIQVAGLDIGKVNDSTVLTHLEVDLQDPVINPIKFEGQDEEKQIYYRKRVIDWVLAEGAFEGRDGQYEKLVQYILGTSIKVLCVDATGMGDPFAERISAMLGDRVVVVPVVFSTPNKSALYKYMLQEFHAYRVWLPGGPTTRESVSHRRFVDEMESLDRVQHGVHVLYQHPDGDDHHDDFPDSLALACHAEKIMFETMIPEVQVTYVGGGRRGPQPSAHSSDGGGLAEVQSSGGVRSRMDRYRRGRN